MISYYPPVEGAVISYEQEAGRLVHAATTTVVEAGSIPVPLDVTPEEEEAWGEKLQRLAGCVA